MITLTIFFSNLNNDSDGNFHRRKHQHRKSSYFFWILLLSWLDCFRTQLSFKYWNRSGIKMKINCFVLLSIQNHQMFIAFCVFIS